MTTLRIVQLALMLTPTILLFKNQLMMLTCRVIITIGHKRYGKPRNSFNMLVECPGDAIVWSKIFIFSVMQGCGNMGD